MKLNIERNKILPPLQSINSVIERRHTMPILSNVLMSITGKDIKLTGTDLEVELITSIPFQSTESKEFTLPARKLLDICKALPEDANLELNIEKDQVILKSGKSRFTLATLPAKDFPNTDIKEASTTLSVPQNKLKELLEETMFAMAQQDVRYYLNGILMEVSTNKLKTVATDGHRLALKELALDYKANEKLQIIIPRKGVLELARLLDSTDEPVEIQISKNHVRLMIDSMQFTSKLIDGKFPDYERVIPKPAEKKIIANKDLLKQSLSRASILSNEKYRGVRILLRENSIKATAHNPEQEEAEEEIEVSYDGDEMEIGFNVTYLLDAINVIKTANVIITITNPDSSCLLVPEGETSSKYVVMPMRL